MNRTMEWITELNMDWAVKHSDSVVNTNALAQNTMNIG